MFCYGRSAGSWPVSAATTRFWCSTTDRATTPGRSLPATGASSRSASSDRNRRLGYSGATEALLREAVRRAEYPKRDVAVTLQADFSDDPAGIVPLMKTVEGGADIVSAAFAEEPPGLTRTARFTRWLARNWLRRTLSSAPVSDPLGGFRAYRVVVLKKMFAGAGETEFALGEGWAGNLELLERALPHARAVAEALVEEPRNRRVRRSRFRPWRTLLGLGRARGRVTFAAAEGS